MAAPESPAPHVPGLLGRVRRAGVGGVLAALRRRARSDAVFLGLRCDLGALPPQRPAALPLEVATEPTAGFSAFAEAAALPDPADLGELRLRQRLVDGGVRTLYVARSEGLGVVYTQWCVAADEEPLIAAVLPDHFRTLAPGEVLLEGAYTFPQARRAGVMGDVMWRLLDDARAA